LAKRFAFRVERVDSDTSSASKRIHDTGDARRRLQEVEDRFQLQEILFVKLIRSALVHRKLLGAKPMFNPLVCPEGEAEDSVLK
jgi:hypothetical protein